MRRRLVAVLLALTAVAVALAARMQRERRRDALAAAGAGGVELARTPRALPAPAQALPAGPAPERAVEASSPIDQPDLQPPAPLDAPAAEREPAPEPEPAAPLEPAATPPAASLPDLPRLPARFVSVHWEPAAAPPAGRPELAIRYTLLADQMQLDRIDVRETGSQVFVTVLARWEPPAGGWFSHAAEHEAVVPLRRPLGERALVHAPVDPGLPPHEPHPPNETHPPHDPGAPSHG